MTHNSLIDFDTVEKNLDHVHQHNRGIQQIAIDKIVGSIGRYTDFTEGFKFHEDRISAKYAWIKQAMLDGKILPPIKVYQILDNYFVIDGHHRVNVAKTVLGAPEIDAEVIKIDFDFELSSDKTYDYDTEQAKRFLIKLEEDAFQRETCLKNGVLIYPLKVTDLTSFGKLYEEVKDFRKNYHNGEFAKKHIALASYTWYEQRFLPAARIIIDEHILDGFQNRTYTDLYLWIQQHKYFLSQQAGHDVGFDFTKHDFMQKYRRVKFLDILPGVFKDIVHKIKLH